MDIVVDFDGTCVQDAYPDIGKDIGSQRVLRRLTGEGHNLILFTMRDRGYLQSAIDWFKENDIPLHGVQYNPNQTYWTSSNKCFGQMYIDDAALGVPLFYPSDGSRPYVDWTEVERELESMGILTPYRTRSDD